MYIKKIKTKKICLCCNKCFFSNRDAKFCSDSCRAKIATRTAPKYFTRNDISDLKNLYKNESKQKVLKRFPNHEWKSIQNIATRLGIPKLHSELSIGNIKKLLYLNKESCYWLGLIATDGYISKCGTLKVSLCINDSKYLSGLSKYLGCNLNYYYKNRFANRFNGSKGIVRVKVKDYTYGVKLRELFKIKDKKTYEPISIDFLKNKYQFFCFFIGMIDGDGSIKKNGRGMCIDMYINQYSFLEKLGNILKKYNFISGFKIQKYLKMCRLNIHRKNDLYNIYRLVKKLKLPILKRKWNRIKDVKIIRTSCLVDNKSTIKKLRKRGYGYKTITKILGYSSFGSLYSFCKRNKIR